MYKAGQLIWLKNIGSFSGKEQKPTRLCIVRRVYEDDKIDLRVLSTIYSDKSRNIKASSLKEAQEALENLFEKKIPESYQYVIFEPDADSTLNFSFSFGNMISKKIDLGEFIHEPLLDKRGNALSVSSKKELELSNKEAEAIATGIIIKYFNVEPLPIKKEVKE